MANQQDQGGNTELQRIAEEYPYYATAQLEYLKSFESNRTPAFHHQAGKTALFFSNTYWLSWQLQALDEDDEEVATVASEDQPATEDPGEKEQQQEILPTEEPTVPDSEKKPGDMNEEGYIIDEEPIPNNPVEVIPVAKPDLEVTTEKTANDPEIAEHRVAEALDKEKATADQAVSGDELSFEPLHTTDYFASQGIKITEEPISNDKLGKQMKSFTEWLKSMKKIHADKLPAGDEQTDKKIQSIAAESNSLNDVVTESMAEVYEKQGKSEKAIEIYTKLSLTNPAKSAYFAAKIQNLKAS